MMDAIKKVLPPVMVRMIQKAHRKAVLRAYRGKTTREVFTRIYETGAWGKASEGSGPFCSGIGSHDPLIVDPYVKAVSAALMSFDSPPDVVDLGCGDFAVGSRIRRYCGNYIACDVVEPLVAHNRRVFGDLGVDFRVLDIVNDSLPAGDVVFIRQVLQHLSNEQVGTVVSKLLGKYRYLVLTEHIPGEEGFTPNLDKPAGPDIRLYVGSGLDLKAEPFNLQAIEERNICEVRVDGSIVRTMLFRLS
jgi:SAM-dependent methyltransferase